MRLLASKVWAKNLINLLGNSDKGCSFWHFFNLSGSNVGASWSKATKNIQYCIIHIPSVFYLNGFPFRCSVLGYTSLDWNRIRIKFE